MGVIKWFFQPLVDTIEYLKPDPLPDIYVNNHYKESTDEPKHIIVQKEVPEYKIFRPQNFDEYIGQEKAKDILRSYITAIKKRGRVLPHILIHGKAGCGKTTLAKIIANELACMFSETITSDIKTSIDLLLKISEIDGGILFLDEIHSIERDTAESIYTIMEDFKYNGDHVKNFTLIGATTEVGEILKNRRPFYDRFKIIIELEDYTPSEIAKIAKKYKDVTFPDDNLDPHIYEIIGKNSRVTPRTGIRLTEATIYLNGDINRVLKNYDIIKDGYTNKDLRILKYISKNEKGVGLQGLVSYLGTSIETYNHDIEPYLLRNELIIRTPRGRKITQEGIEKIKELESVENA